MLMLHPNASAWLPDMALVDQHHAQGYCRLALAIVEQINPPLWPVA